MSDTPSPTVIMDINCTKRWYLYGQLHRGDGPAIEHTSGAKEWYINGKRHRVDGPAIEHTYGAKQWYINGKRHRADGPAIESPTMNNGWWIEWWIEGLLHRIDGPAIEYSNGTKEWYLYGVRVSLAYFYAILRLIKVRRRVRLFHSIIPQLHTLSSLVKTKTFCEWYYHPDRPGGRYAKKQLVQLSCFSKPIGQY